MGFIKEFRDFAMRGNVVDMAVGIIIGVSFGAIIKTLVDKVMMPPLGYLMGGLDFADKKIVLKEGALNDAGEVVTPEVAMYWGEFVNVTINFIIVAFALFIVIKIMNSAKKKFEKEQEAAPPPPPAEDIILLREIRDSLKKG